MPLVNKLYRKLLLLYPLSYRTAYGKEIANTFDDMLANEPIVYRRLIIILKELLMLPGNVAEQYLNSIQTVTNISLQNSVALVGFLLLIPFFGASLLDELSEHLSGAHAFHTWIWSPFAIGIWIILLPALSMFISLTIYTLTAIRKSIKVSKVVMYPKGSLPLAIVTILSASILALAIYQKDVNCLHASPDGTTFLQCVVTNITTHDTK